VICTLCSSAKVKHGSIAKGVVPKSSCNFNPLAPLFNTLTREAFRSLVLPFPLHPKLRGRSSVARSIISTWEGPGVQVVADVPALGPVPPPYSVVMPLAMASSHCWGQMNWVWVSTPPRR